MRSEMVSFQTNTSVICPYVRARLWRGEEGGECERGGGVVESVDSDIFRVVRGTGMSVFNVDIY